MQDFFGYQWQQASGMASESNLYGGDVAETASGGHKSLIKTLVLVVEIDSEGFTA